MKLVIHSLLILITVLGTFSVSAPSFADQDSLVNTGNELTGNCNAKNSESQNSAWLFCVAEIKGLVAGIVAGVHWGYIDATNKAVTPKQMDAFLPFCLPDGVTTGQVALVVTQYLNNHPEQLNQPAPSLVVFALVNAWPCLKK